MKISKATLTDYIHYIFVRTPSWSKKLAILSHVHFSSHMTCCLAPWSSLAVFLANSNPPRIPWWICLMQDWKQGKWMMRLAHSFSDIYRRISVHSALCWWRIFALVSRIELSLQSLSTTHMGIHVGTSMTCDPVKLTEIRYLKSTQKLDFSSLVPSVSRNLVERGESRSGHTWRTGCSFASWVERERDR